MAHSRVPKFGDWDSDNVPYTACFENARRERTTGDGFIMNPNDPQQNPDAFNTSSLEKRSLQQRRSRGSQASFMPESDSYRSISDNTSSLQRGVRSDNNRSMSRGGSVVGSFSTSTHSRHRSGSHSSVDYTSHRQTSIPKFGAWDETDPKSGEGFTVIFNKIKKEKQIASGQYPTLSPQPTNYSNIPNHYAGSSFRLSKYCCCLFSCQSK